MSTAELVVSAGEASGDAMAAAVVARLGTASFGIGGGALAAAGTTLVEDLGVLAGMGLPGPARALRVAQAAGRLLRNARCEPPRAALLVGFSELNGVLAGRLRALGTKVCWYAPPQVWAWRPRRARRIAERTDLLALTLPFELEVWRRAGARAHYVGHPALERAAAAAAGRLAPEPPAPGLRAPEPATPTPAEPGRAGAPRVLALLPGSRPEEVRGHLDLLLEAAAEPRLRGHFERARLVVAPSLPERTRRWLGERGRRARGLPLEVSAAPIAVALGGCRAALAVSGTVTLDCVAAGVPPVILYRTHPLVYAAVRHLIRVPHIGLPNLVLGRRAFPELVQDALQPGALSAALLAVMTTHDQHLASCGHVVLRLREPLDPEAPEASEQVARLLRPWLA